MSEKEEKQIESTLKSIYDIMEEICKTEEIFKKNIDKKLKAYLIKKRIF